MATKKTEQPQKITLEAALARETGSMGREAKYEFHRVDFMAGHEILTLGYGLEIPMPGFPNPPLEYRVAIYVDGKPRAGAIVS